jgi:hypothetical protein
MLSVDLTPAFGHPSHIGEGLFNGGSVVYCGYDCVNYFGDVIHDLIVAETDFEKPSSIEYTPTMLVVNFLFVGFMNATVYFNDQFRLMAKEINDKTLDHLLASEFYPLDVIVPKACPKFFLGRGRHFAKFMGCFQLVSIYPL